MITTILLAAVLSCPVTVPPGEVTAMVFYEHEYPAGTLWTVETTSVGPGEADIQVEGYPVAVEWWQNGKMLKRCGTRPSRIMWNGFESGTTEAWSRVAP